MVSRVAKRTPRGQGGPRAYRSNHTYECREGHREQSNRNPCLIVTILSSSYDCLLTPLPYYFSSSSPPRTPQLHFRTFVVQPMTPPPTSPAYHPSCYTPYKLRSLPPIPVTQSRPGAAGGCGPCAPGRRQH
eukprot:758029-Hanusia_phi.AAC.1